MSVSLKLILGAACVAGSLGSLAGVAQAQTVTQQCSAQYQAAKTANTLNGMSWNQFRSDCSAKLKAQPAAATAPVAPAAPIAPAAPVAPVAPVAPAVAANPLKPVVAATPVAPVAPVVPAAPVAPVAVGNAVFPAAIAPAYASESAGKARQHTCLDQYKANKTANANGGMEWIQKGGGYYSVCNKRLKG